MLPRRRTLTGALSLAALAARPASGVTILDSTWRAEGGRPGQESRGFRAHEALANEPQFASLVALSEDDGDSWDTASGTWIGNIGGHGYILTSGHNFEAGEGADHFLYRTGRGTVHEGERLDIHPFYSRTVGDRTGYDAAIVRLTEPVTDAGPPPALYAGNAELGKQIVMVGYGARGIGSVGENKAYNDGTGRKAAATNIVSEVKDTVQPVPVLEDVGNWIQITLRREEEGAGRLDGLLGSGDSGGSAWMRTANGWVIVGINANGTGDANYGDESQFARVSGLRSWIQRIAPGLRYST